VYFLDTDTCSDAVSAHPSVLHRLEQLDRDQWAISSIVKAELRYGLENGKLLSRTQLSLEKFLALAAVVVFDDKAAVEAAKVRAEQEKTGRPSGAVDQLIAGHARALGATLVTSNLKHFSPVVGLVTETWR